VEELEARWRYVSSAFTPTYPAVTVNFQTEFLAYSLKCRAELRLISIVHQAVIAVQNLHTMSTFLQPGDAWSFVWMKCGETGHLGPQSTSAILPVEACKVRTSSHHHSCWYPPFPEITSATAVHRTVCWQQLSTLSRYFRRRKVVWEVLQYFSGYLPIYQTLSAIKHPRVFTSHQINVSSGNHIP